MMYIDISMYSMMQTNKNKIIHLLWVRREERDTTDIFQCLFLKAVSVL